MNLDRIVTMNGSTVLGYDYQLPTTVEGGLILLQQERDFRRRAGGYKVGDLWFHSDLESKVEQIGLLLLGVNLPPIGWKTLSGVKVQLSPAVAQSIFQAAVQSTTALFNACEEKQSQLTPENVATFDYFGGWPVAYWESR